MSEPAVDIAPVEVGLDPADAMAQAAKEAHEREMMGEMPQDAVQLPHHEVRMSVSHLDLFYGDHPALKNVNIDIREREITSFIGPSGCGKSTLLRCLNRMNDYVKDKGLSRRRQDYPRWPRYLSRLQRHAPAPAGGHGVSASQSFSNERLR